MTEGKQTNRSAAVRAGRPDSWFWQRVDDSDGPVESDPRPVSWTRFKGMFLYVLCFDGYLGISVSIQGVCFIHG